MTEQTQMDVFTPRDRLDAIVGIYEGEWQDGALDAADPKVHNDAELYTLPWVMVERNFRGGECWITLFATLDEAGEYHVNQEYAEDWEFVAAYNIVSGQVVRTMRVGVTFGPSEPWAIDIEGGE